MLLTGCGTTLTDCPEPTPIPADVQGRAAVELEALPNGSALAQVVVASLNDRDKLRACRSIR
tara:strand:- start:11177 stop:11362 length:186 start_codon:yes stop_codon:yes gene_type:complete